MFPPMPTTFLLAFLEINQKYNRRPESAIHAHEADFKIFKKLFPSVHHPVTVCISGDADFKSIFKKLFPPIPSAFPLAFLEIPSINSKGVRVRISKFMRMRLHIFVTSNLSSLGQTHSAHSQNLVANLRSKQLNQCQHICVFQ